MSKYTYYISTNSSDYTQVYPNGDVLITCEPTYNDFTYQLKINDFKLTKTLNSTVYDTLYSWFHDSTKFETPLYLKIKSSGVDKHIFKFGIKWGEIDEEVGTYTFKAEVDDDYFAIESAFGLIAGNSAFILFANVFDYIDPHTWESFTGFSLYSELMTTAIDSINLYYGASLTFKSSIFNNDNLPDGTSVGVGNYVTGATDSNPLNNLVLYNSAYAKTVKDVLDFPQALQCYWYIDENGALRIEHASFFLDLIANYQVDLTGDDSINKILTYTKSEIPLQELFYQSGNDDTFDSDWDQIKIRYNIYRNQLGGIDKEYRMNAFTNISDTAKTNSALACIISPELVTIYTNINMSTFTYNGVVVSSLVGINGSYFETNSIIYDSVNYSITFANLTLPTERIYMEVYNAGGGVGSPVQMTNGVNTGTLSLAVGDWVRFYCETGVNCQITALSFTKTGVYKVAFTDGAKSGDPKANGYLSLANIVSSYWLDYRLSLSGELMETTTAFNSTQYNLEQTQFKKYYPNDIDPLRGIMTDFGIAKIKSYERNLSTDFVTFKLSYQEDV